MHPFAEVTREDLSFITHISVTVRVLFYLCAGAPCVLVLVRLDLQGCSCIRAGSKFRRVRDRAAVRTD
jgi:hypothetical protein